MGDCSLLYSELVWYMQELYEQQSLHQSATYPRENQGLPKALHIRCGVSLSVAVSQNRTKSP